MIPQRFTIEYPQRCAELLRMLEPQAREQNLVGSFALLVASAAFTIPFARMTEKKHPVGQPEPELYDAIERLKDRSFLKAPFWDGKEPGFFRYAKITAAPEFAGGWRNAADKHPIKSTEDKDGNTVLRVIRNALAHGNVVYLNEDGFEAPKQVVRYLAFLSKHDSGVGHRVVLFDEESFLDFLKRWIVWIQKFPSSAELVFEKSAQ